MFALESSPNLMAVAGLLDGLSGLSTVVIVALFATHVFGFFVLWVWWRRDLRAIATSLDEFTRGLRHRSLMDSNAHLSEQVEAFLADVGEVLDGTGNSQDRHLLYHRMAILVLVAFLLASTAEAAVCTTAPSDVHFAITRHRVLKIGCWSHTLTKTKYTSLHDAHDACERSAACNGIHDVTCDGHVFFLCDSAHNFTTPPNDNGDAPPCVYVKPSPKEEKVASGANLSANA